jgi:hypothetical protein
MGQADKYVVLHYDHPPALLDRHLSEESIDRLAHFDDCDPHLSLCWHCTERVLKAKEFDRIIRKAMQNKSLTLRLKSRRR